jgi:hypothetical protein
MSKKTVDSGLWGRKSDMSEKLEGCVYPVWLSCPSGSKYSGPEYVNKKIEAAMEDSTELEFTFDVSLSDAPERVREKLEDFADENGVPDRWGLHVEVGPRGAMDQGEMYLFGEYT